MVAIGPGGAYVIGMTRLAFLLVAFALPAGAQSLAVCGDLSASARDVAHHCRLALKKGRMNAQQEYAARLNLGDALLQLGREEEALEAFDAALAVNLTRVEAYIGRAGALEALGRRGDALRDWDRALKMAPESVDIRMGRGAFFLRGRDLEAAIGAFDEALARDPEAADALYNRGLALMRLGRPDLAERDFSALLRLNPSDAAAYLNRGLARDEATPGGALADFDRAADLAPEWGAPWYYSGRLLDRLGRRAEANRRLRRAFELGVNDPWLLRRIQELGG